MKIIPEAIKFLHFAENLKNELRNGRTSTNKHESVAEHSWRVSLMVMIFAPLLDKEICVVKALKMAIIHDLAEAITGDKPYFVHEKNDQMKVQKFADEMDAMNSIKNALGGGLGKEIFELWKEYEESTTYEGKFVKALDKIEAQLQHNEIDFNHWNEHDLKYALNRLDDYCYFDSFLTNLKDQVQEESRKKMVGNHAEAFVD